MVKGKILLIGPQISEDSKSIGGATMAFSYLVDYFKQESIPHSVINTQQGAIKLLLQIIKQLFKCKVLFLNTSMGGVRYLAPIVGFISLISNRTFIYRAFGASLHDQFVSYNFFQKFIFEKFVLTCDLLLLETKKLIKDFGSGDNLMWLPNSRNQPKKANQNNQVFRRRFIYLGIVREEKGLDLIISLAKKIDDITVHVYGPIFQDKYNFLKNEKWLYKGILEKDDVIPTLNRYDVLILPTHYQGEGYPGSIIEAFSLSKPVITTHWRSIPEIVENGVNGYLFEPKSYKEFEDAVLTISDRNYPQLSVNAGNHFENNFRSETLYQKLLERIKQVTSI